MPEPTVTLRLRGAVTDDRLRAWVRALGRVPAGRRLLQLPALDEAPDALADWLRAAAVEFVDDAAAAETPAVLVLADATALPSPTSLPRLVAAAADGVDVVGTRVLPHGAVTRGDDGITTPAPHACVAVPAAAPAECLRARSPEEAVACVQGSGTDVRRLDAASVFVADSATGDLGRLPDQPYGHPAALPSTALHRLLTSTGVTPPALPTDLEARPFLSVLIRTQGVRLQCLEEVFTCLAGQSSHDFEVLLACHRVADDGLAAVRRVLDDLPTWLAERVRLLEVERPGRSAPLNDALDVARGRYAVMLDDDDAVAADWVGAFAEVERAHPGVVLRSVAFAEDVRPVPVEDADGPRGPVPSATGPAHRVWPEVFHMADHLWDNASPPMTFAVPRGVFDDLGHRFDESLNTTEDWDFLMRAATITGVASTPAATATYRVWKGTEGSRHLHDEAEWAAGREVILGRLDAQPIVLQPGAAREVRDLHRALEHETAEKFRFAQLNESAAEDLRTVNEAVVALRERIGVLEERLARRRQRQRPD